MQPWPDPKDDLGLLARMGPLSDDEILRRVRATFHELIIGELRRTLAGEIGVAAAILSCCAIDFLGTLYAGEDSSGPRFRSFMQAYMPSGYDGGWMWTMRNRLVHNYVLPPDSYGFTVGRALAVDHLQPVAPAEQARWLILDILADDLEAAGERLLQDARTDGALRANILKRWNTPGFLSMFP